MKKQLSTLAAGLALTATSFAQDALPVVISSDLTLSANSEHRLVGVHYVAPGATLTIEPGVTVYAEQISEAPTLIVTNGATINANGTADAPIVFTSIQAQTETLDHNDVGLWSGIIVLGDASINADVTEIASADGVVLTNLIEGIDAIGRGGLSAPVEAGYLTYGGSNDADSSGSLTYVSIRHTGFSLTGESGDEIQGLTLGGVGSGTTLENIEIFVSDDDGVEIFGGTAVLKNLVVGYAEDDSIDLDQGYRGFIQNALVVQVDFTDENGDSRDGDHGGEWDGADTPETNTPSAGWVLANATFIAAGETDGTNDTPIRIRNAGAGQIWNSAFVTNGDDWIRLDNNTDNNIVEDAFLAGTTAFVGNIYYNGEVTELADSLFDINNFADEAGAIAAITADSTNNVVADPGIDVSVATGGMISIEYPSSGVLFSTDQVVTVPFETTPLDNEQYVGAFGRDNWADWTFMYEQGYLAFEALPSTDSLVALSSRLTVNAGASVNVGLILTADADVVITAKSIADAADSLEDPTITLFQFDGTEFVSVQTNDNFDSAVTFPSAVAPVVDSDAGFILNLQAGAYAIIVSGATATDAGEVLVEAYDLDYAFSVSE